MAFVIIYDENKCCGSGVCEAVAEGHWRIGKAGKAEMAHSTAKGDGTHELIVQDVAPHLRAAEGCPPGCIRIVDQSTGHDLALDR